VPLACLLIALVRAGRMQGRAQWGGLLMALGVMLGVCTPHALWFVQHDYSTLRYASEAVASATLGQRLGFILSFAVNQIRLWFPAFLAMGVVGAWSRWVRPAPAAAPVSTWGDVPAPGLQAWWWGLVWSGWCVLALMALGAGVSLRNHWGVQALQFFSLWLASVWDARRTVSLRQLVVAALLVHGVSLFWYAAEHLDPHRVLDGRRMDTHYPAQRLAAAATAHWAAHTSCPLRFVAGTVFEAGLVALYADGPRRWPLQLFDSERATPWVAATELKHAGAVYVLNAADAVPPGLSHLVQFQLVPGRTDKIICLGLRMPMPPCP
jgi:hypothetical protein